MEKRRFRRIKEGVKVIYKTLGEKDERQVAALDIGAGGLCIPIPKRMAPGTLLELGIFLPHDNLPIFSLAKVAWQHPLPKRDRRGGKYFETGVEFLKMGVEGRRKVIQYVYERYRKGKKKASP
jgi:c-di-GMP-binding flagellar brake protein YcgR